MTLLIVALAIVVADSVLRTVLHRERVARKGYARGAAIFRWLRVAVNAAGFVALVAVSQTALYNNDKGLTGDRLISHVTAAGPFAVLAVLVAIFWAHRNQFGQGDLKQGWALPLRKLFFWASVALAIPTFLSILAAMYPVTDTEGQADLIRIHKACGPWLAASAFLFAYFALVSWWERSQD